MTSLDPSVLQRTAVLFLVFNRPDTTREVFSAIRAARPARLYVASDGARANKPGEAAIVEAVRRSVLESVDWPCTVHTLLRESNLGCRDAVSGAISWFFEHEEEGIILEDDCLPSSSFFPFCETLLEKYRDDVTVAGITGDFRPVTSNRSPSSIGRVGYPLIWGWASWRRVWNDYDATMSLWTGDPNDFPRLATKPRATRRYLRLVFDAVKQGEINTWDLQFNFLLQHARQDFLHPHINLITNIGFASGATHTADANDPNAALPRGEVEFPLEEPVEGRAYEAWLERKVFVLRSLATKAKNRLYRWSAMILDR
ncbi:MAG: nucleotide-diphospho-sugar transferase [Flavobacteriales bacterium]